METVKVRGLISHFEDLTIHSTSRVPSFCSTSSRTSSLVEIREDRVDEYKGTSRLAKLRDVIKSQLEFKKNNANEDNASQDKRSAKLKKNNVSKVRVSEDKKSEAKVNKTKASKVKKSNNKESEDKIDKRNKVKINKAKVSEDKATLVKTKLKKIGINEDNVSEIRAKAKISKIQESEYKISETELKKNKIYEAKVNKHRKDTDNDSEDNARDDKSKLKKDKRNEVKTNKDECNASKYKAELNSGVLLRRRELMPFFVSSSSISEDEYNGEIGKEGRSSIVSHNRKKFEKKTRESYDETRKSYEIRKSHEMKKIDEIKKINEMKNNEMKNYEVQNNKMNYSEMKNNEMKNNEMKNYEMKNNEMKNEMKNNEMKNEMKNEAKHNEMKNNEMKNGEMKNNEMKNYENYEMQYKKNNYDEQRSEAKNSEVKYSEAANSEVRNSKINSHEMNNQTKKNYELWSNEVRNNYETKNNEMRNNATANHESWYNETQHNDSNSELDTSELKNTELKNDELTNAELKNTEFKPNNLKAANEMRKKQFFATHEEQFAPIKNKEKESIKLDEYEASFVRPEPIYEHIYSYVTFEKVHQSYKPKTYVQNEVIYETIPDFEEEVLYDTLLPPEVDYEKREYENVFLPHLKRIHYENFSCKDLRCCSSTFYIPLQVPKRPNKTDSSYYSADEDDIEVESDLTDLGEEIVCPPRLVQRIGVINPKLDDEVTVYENFIVRGPNADPSIAIQLDKDKKDYIVDELIYTENAYVDSLEYVIQNYMIYLKEHTETSKYKYIFTNIDNIYLETKYFQEEIKGYKYNYEEIGQTFLRHRNLFARYPIYCKNKAKSLQLINEDFKDIITKRELELGDKLGLSSHLLKPIQRLGKYELLLKNLYACLKKDQEELGQKSVEAAIVMIQRVTRQGNDLITLTTIEDNPHTIIDTGGFLLKESFKLHSPKKMEVVLFLFEKILIFTTKKKQEGYMYYTYIPLESLAKQNAPVGSNIFIIEDYHMKKRHGDPPFVIEAREAELKEKWTKQIDELLWMQLRKRKEEAKTVRCQRMHSLITTRTLPTQITLKKSVSQKTKEKKRLFSFSLLTK